MVISGFDWRRNVHVVLHYFKFMKRERGHLSLLKQYKRRERKTLWMRVTWISWKKSCCCLRAKNESIFISTFFHVVTHPHTHTHAPFLLLRLRTLKLTKHLHNHQFSSKIQNLSNFFPNWKHKSAHYNSDCLTISFYIGQLFSFI